ncbi:MAG: transposase family protein [Candidatus Saccharicenans sp.]|nr:transposase family protein [Candidatus Saccharicenans sp.]
MELRKVKRRRKPVYDEKVKEWLGWFWWLFNYPCGKPLVVMMREVCPKLEAMGRVKLPFRLKEKLWRVSASTADRLLQPERRKMALRSRARTKPGTLLKHQIPVRTFSDWDEQKPGFLEMDLVGHDGGVTRGDFCHSLNATDVATSWTEAEVVRNRAQVWVFEALQRIEKRLPFKLLGLDSDNDAAFINAHLIRYCQERHLSFTRGRAGRKNDSCYVEQKNYTAVRKLVGYLRYDRSASSSFTPGPGSIITSFG